MLVRVFACKKFLVHRATGHFMVQNLENSLFSLWWFCNPVFTFHCNVSAAWGNPKLESGFPVLCFRREKSRDRHNVSWDRKGEEMFCPWLIVWSGKKKKKKVLKETLDNPPSSPPSMNNTQLPNWVWLSGGPSCFRTNPHVLRFFDFSFIWCQALFLWAEK